MCLNPTTPNSSNTQHLNAIYTNRQSSIIISTTNSSGKRNTKELEINTQVNGKYKVYNYDNTMLLKSILILFNFI